MQLEISRIFTLDFTSKSPSPIIKFSASALQKNLFSTLTGKYFRHPYDYDLNFAICHKRLRAEFNFSSLTWHYDKNRYIICR